MDIPELLHPLRHRLRVQTRWADYDMLGHVNNTVYFQYMDLAKTDYFLRELGGEFNPRRDALVIVNTVCDYFHISLPSEELEVLSGVETIGQRSLVMLQRVVNASTGEVKCQCRSVLAAFSVKDAQAIDVPDAWRRLISAYEGREMQAQQ